MGTNKPSFKCCNLPICAFHLDICSFEYLHQVSGWKNRDTINLKRDTPGMKNGSPYWSGVLDVKRKSKSRTVHPFNGIKHDKTKSRTSSTSCLFNWFYCYVTNPPGYRKVTPFLSHNSPTSSPPWPPHPRPIGTLEGHRSCSPERWAASYPSLSKRGGEKFHHFFLGCFLLQ